MWSGNVSRESGRQTRGKVEIDDGEFRALSSQYHYILLLEKYDINLLTRVNYRITRVILLLMLFYTIIKR